MNRRTPSKAAIAATIALQQPDHPRGAIIGAGDSAAYRDPASLTKRWVCCHCKRGTTTHRFLVDGHWVETHHCPEHGDVPPMRSHIVNPETTS